MIWNPYAVTPDDEKTRTDGVCPLGYRQLLGGPDQPLSAFSHEPERLVVASGVFASRPGGTLRFRTDVTKPRMAR